MYDQTSKKRGTIFLLIVFGLWIILGIVLPFIQFLIIFLLTSPFFIAVFLKKKCGWVATILLTFLLTLFIDLAIVGSVGFVLYKDFTQLKSDFLTKPKYTLYPEGRILILHLIPGSSDLNRSPRFLSPENVTSLSRQDAIVITISKAYIEDFKSQGFSSSEVLLELEGAKSQEVKNRIFEVSIIQIIQEGGISYTFKELKEGKISIEPEYLSIRVIKGIPLGLVKEFATMDIGQIMQEQPVGKR